VKNEVNIKEKRGGGGINLCVSYIERPLKRLLLYGGNTEFCSEARAAVNVEGLQDIEIRKINGCINPVKGKGKAVPLQACSGPEGSRKLRFPDCMTTAQDGGKDVSLTHRPPYPQEMLLVLISDRG
jgi:hypothetical protein